MKNRITVRVLRGALGLVAVILLAGCYLGGTPESGSLTFTMPSSEQLSQVGVQAVNVAQGDTARLYLAIDRGGQTQLVPIEAEGAEGQQFREVSATQDQETIEGIPVGDNYLLYAAFGSGDGDAFDVKAFAWTSETFSVAAGSASTVNLSLVENDLRSPATQVAALDINGLVTANGTIYLSTGDGEVWTVGASGGTDATDPIEATGATGDIQSVSGGGTSTSVFVNAVNGIFEVNTADSSLQKVGFPDGSNYGTPFTAIEFDADTSDNQRPIAFQTNKGLGFVLEPDDPESWEFFPTSGEDAAFSIPGRPIFDFAVDVEEADPEDDSADLEARAFLATKLGGFAVSPALIEDLADVEGAVDAVEVFPFYDGAIDNKVAQALAYDTANDVLYVGTQSGAYKVVVTEDDDGKAVFTGENLSNENGVPQRVVDVAAQAVVESGESYVAFLSNFWVTVYRGTSSEGEIVARIPFVAFDEEPGQARFVAFRDTDGDDRDDELIVGGANGLRTISLSDLEN